MSGDGRHVYLSGPMGTGKTTVGRLLATLMDRAFIDLDGEVERQAGQSVKQIFAQEGEAGFRQRERAALREVLGRPPAVVALGGGTVVDPTNRHVVRTSGRLVTLMAPAATLRERLAGDESRPLLAEHPEVMEDLLASRQVAYADADRVVATDRRSPAEVAQAIHHALASPTELLLPIGRSGQRVVIGHDVEDHLVLRLRERVGPGGLIIVTDETVAPLHGHRLRAQLLAAGLRAELVTVPAGEASKSLTQVEALYDRCLALGADRSTVIVAMGGGVVGDLAGFVAATLLRGLHWVLLPTTLLAMVDSSIGGKTAVNHAGGKNLIGAFHQPDLVFADTAWLRTLPAREVRAGLAEAVKHGLVAEPALLDLIRTAARALAEGRLEALVGLVTMVVRAKAGIVAEDERDEGRRVVLNFGHTLAHALEAARPGELRHGEAVALGMACDLERSVALGLSPADRDKALALLADLGLDVGWRAWISQAVLDKVAKDKKIRGEYVDDVLLRGPGRPSVEAVTVTAWRQAVARLAGVAVEA